MATYKDKLHFTYNGVSSKSHGIISVQLDSGMFDETLVSDMENDFTYNNMRNTVLYSGSYMKPRTFDLTLAFENKFTDSKIQQVVNWLYTDYFSPIIFDGTPNRIMYCKPYGESKIVHTGENRGYIEISMQTNSPYVFGQKVVGNSVGNLVTVQNTGLQFPETKITITSNVNGRVSLANGSNNVHINDCKDGEVITIYPNDEDIQSSMMGRVLYDNVVGDLSHLMINKGENIIQIVDGASSLKVEFEPYFLH